MKNANESSEGLSSFFPLVRLERKGGRIEDGTEEWVGWSAGSWSGVLEML